MLRGRCRGSVNASRARTSSGQTQASQGPDLGILQIHATAPPPAKSGSKGRVIRRKITNKHK